MQNQINFEPQASNYKIGKIFTPQMAEKFYKTRFVTASMFTFLKCEVNI
jgi:hypothetical protein